MDGASQESTQTNKLSPEQSELVGTENELAKRQLSMLDDSYGALKQVFLNPDSLAQQQELQQLQLQSAKQAAQDAADNAPIVKQINEMTLQRLKDNGAATPEQTSMIDEMTRAQTASGTSDIRAQASDTLKQLRDETTTSLGLRPTDSPIQDRADLIGKEATRQIGQLTNTMAATNASAKLNFPLAVGQLQNSTAQVAAGLQNSALSNRLMLTQGLGSAAGGGLGQFASFVTGFNPNVAGAIGGLSGYGTKTGSGTQSDSTLTQIGQAVKIAGSVASMAGGMSSEYLKEELAKLTADDEAEILNEILDLPIQRWRYKWDEEPHIGPYAEELKDTIGIGDGFRINFIDAIGTLFAAVKALGRAHARINDGTEPAGRLARGGSDRHPDDTTARRERPGGRVTGRLQLATA